MNGKMEMTDRQDGKNVHSLEKAGEERSRNIKKIEAARRRTTCLFRLVGIGTPSNTRREE